MGGGILIIPVLMSTGLLGMHLIATDAVIGLSVLVAKTTTYGKFSLLDARLALFGLLIGAWMIPGTCVAGWLVRRTGIKLHTLLMEAVIVIGGLGFLWRAVEGGIVSPPAGRSAPPPVAVGRSLGNPHESRVSLVSRRQVR